MSEVGQYSHNLILMSKCSNKWAHRIAAPKFMQKFELILDPCGTAGDVYLFNGNVSRLFSFSLSQGTRFRHAPQPSCGNWKLPRCGGLCGNIPVILVMIVVHVFCFIYSGESSWKNEASVHRLKVPNSLPHLRRCDLSFEN